MRWQSFCGEQQFIIMLSKKKQQKYIYAIRNRILQQGKSGKPEAISQTIGALSSNFVLAIAPEISHQLLDGLIVEQERSKFGQFLYSFEVKGNIKIIPENVLVSFPIVCNEQDGKFQLTEEQFKKFIFEFKAILNHDQSDDSSYSRYSESQQQISSIDHRCRGRPKGSKNRRKESVEKSSQEEFMDESNKKFQEKRGRGRPKGAKNIKKQMSSSGESNINQLNVFQLFVHLFETKSIEEVNTKINRLKDRDDRLMMVKKEELEGEQMIKRSRGRPKGVKNKPKLNNEQSESEQTQQIQTLPKRRQTKSHFFGKCCNSCNQKQQKKFFIEGKISSIDNLTNVTERISVENNQCIILYLIKSGETQLLREVLAKKNTINYPFILSWDCFSRLQEYIYTIKTKKDYIYRGKRQGINALIQDCYRGYETNWWKILGVEKILQSIPNSKHAIEIYEMLIEDDPQLKKQMYLNIASLVRSGNEILSSYLLEKVLKEEDNNLIYGYSKDHLECFSKKKNEIQFKKSAMLKQSYTANFCSPIHCAIVNSNIELLSYILKHISDFNVGDSYNRKPIHYAAVLENSKALEILIKHGAELKDMDKRKMTPLMLAAKYGRFKNLKIILDKVKDPHYINFKGDQGLAALHYAVIERNYEEAVLLLDDPLVEKEVETKEGMNIFHIAAGNGQKDLVKNLLERGFNPEQPDNYRRTPLMIAIRNYQNQIFFHIFNSLQRYYKRDYSYNTLLHYAAAYGNMEIVKFFMQIGTSQTMNRKSFYPFEIAVLKGHYQCAKLLQNWTLHFSHHLLNRISKNPRGTQQYYEIYEYLLETRRYDLNYRNPAAYGYTCLHFICAISEAEYYQARGTQSTIVAPNEYKLMQEKLIKLLLKYGADPQVQNDRGEKALKLCIENENIVGIQLLLTEIPFELHPPTRNNNYVYYLTNISCLGWKEMQFVYDKLVNTDEKVLRTQLKKVDINGFQLLIYLIKKFTETVHTNFRNSFVAYRDELVAEGAGNSEEINKLASLKALSDYLKHQEYLIKTVNYLVDNGSDPKYIVSEPKMDEQYENYKKWGIQHFLMKFPSLNLLKIFMKWIDTHFNLQNSEGRTPLHLFCLWNNEGCLFNNYSVLNDPLPIINYPEFSPFQGRKCLEYLLENGLTCNVLDINRSTPLLYAAARGQLGFIRLLRNFGSTINNVNSLNQVPLIQLIRQKNKFSLEQIDNILFDEGLRADFKDLNERNVLHHLVSLAKNFDNSPEICKKLLEYGVNINSLDKFGRSPIFYCFIRIEENQYPSDDSNDKVEILQSLLTHPELNINIVDIYQRTPLHYACEKQFFFSILYLLQKNIDYDVVDAQGNTPLAICLKHKNLNQAAMLIKRGVKYGCVVEDGQHDSYITYSIRKLSIGICFILIDHGYPLEKALEESAPYREMLLKRYVREKGQ